MTTTYYICVARHRTLLRLNRFRRTVETSPTLPPPPYGMLNAGHLRSVVMTLENKKGRSGTMNMTQAGAIRVSISADFALFVVQFIMDISY